MTLEEFIAEEKARLDQFSAAWKLARAFVPATPSDMAREKWKASLDSMVLAAGAPSRAS